MYSTRTIQGVAAAAFLLVSVTFATAVSAQGGAAGNAESGWQNEIMIYGWFAGIDGEVEFPRRGRSDFSIDASDLIDNLNMIFMAGYEGKYRRWSFVIDTVYLDVGEDGNTGTALGPAAAALDVKSLIINTGVGYDLVQNDKGNISVVGGLRYLDLDVDADATLANTPVISVDESENFLDAFVGLRGTIRFGDGWYLPFYCDIGGGDTDLSYQLFGGIGYQRSWWDIRLGYRYLSFDFDDDMIMQDLQVGGPLLGFGFKF